MAVNGRPSTMRRRYSSLIPRQDGIGQDRVDHAASALDFRATGDHQLDHGVVVAQRHLVVFRDAPSDAVELERTMLPRISSGSG
jgi:hypothetical protein